MVDSAQIMVKKLNFQQMMIWTSSFHFRTLWKGYQNYIHKITDTTDATEQVNSMSWATFQHKKLGDHLKVTLSQPTKIKH